MTTGFHEILFPISVALQGSGGPERKTDIVVTGSGREERIARWANSLRRYDAGTGVKTLPALQSVIAFFEERRGRLYGFRWRDRVDWQSCSLGATPSPTDQIIATGDGTTTQFQLIKLYGGAFAPYSRVISKPVTGSVRIAVAGQEILIGQGVSVDNTTGLVSFTTAPASGAAITAGFGFDVPVRFDTDSLLIDYSAFIAGEIPKIPIVEIIP
jgi:uncharacterized protein (TIGR02217 family)